MKNAMPAHEDKWQIEDDFRTLQRAEEIRNDPKRLKKALDFGREKQAEIMTLLRREKGLRG